MLNKPTEERDHALKQLPPKLVSILGKEGLLQDDDDASKTQIRLSAETRKMVDGYFKDSDFLMSYEEARKHREELMKERTVFTADAQSGWQQQHSYNFCEH